MTQFIMNLDYRINALDAEYVRTFAAYEVELQNLNIAAEAYLAKPRPLSNVDKREARRVKDRLLEVTVAQEGLKREYLRRCWRGEEA